MRDYDLVKLLISDPHEGIKAADKSWHAASKVTPYCQRSSSE
jgi:hypothetical protein